jgi:hypothetical protein
MTEEIARKLDEIAALMIQADSWSARVEGVLYRFTLTREVLGGQACGCDPKVHWPCETPGCGIARAIRDEHEQKRREYHR